MHSVLFELSFCGLVSKIMVSVSTTTIIYDIPNSIVGFNTSLDGLRLHVSDNGASKTEKLRIMNI